MQRLHVQHPEIGKKTGVGQAFDEFIKTTGLTFLADRRRGEF